MSDILFMVDTNVLVAGLITADSRSPTSEVVNAMLDGRLFYLLSAELLLEYRNVLLRPRISMLHGLGEEEIDRLLNEITANAIWREIPDNTHLQPPDPGDAHLWALLESEPTAVLITGDRLLLDNPPLQRSAISPATWAGRFSR